MLCRIQSISKTARKYGRSSLYLLAAVAVLAFSYYSIDFTNRSLLAFCLAVPLGVALVFIAISGRDGESGMSIGEFDGKESLAEDAETFLVEADPFAGTRTRFARRMGAPCTMIR